MSELTDDEAAVEARYPGLAKVGARIRIPFGPLAGEPIIIRRKLTERGGVLLSMQYADATIREWEWFD